MMKFCLVTNKGCEHWCINEWKEKTKGIANKVSPGLIIAESNLEPPRLQSVHYITKVLLVEKTINQIKERINEIDKIPGESFAFRMHPKGDEAQIGGLLAVHLEKKVDLKNPDLILRMFFSDKVAILGIDSFNEKISNRYYKVFSTRASLNPVTGFVLGYAGVKGKTAFLLTADGIPIIEAKLFNKDANLIGFSKDVVLLKGARKNSIAAQVEIEFEEQPGKIESLVCAFPFMKNLHGKHPWELAAGFQWKLLTIICLPEEKNNFLKIGKPILNQIIWQGKLKLELLQFKKD